jgi:toluene monooxygenase system protein A
MPRLARSEWYELTRDMNWTLSYADEDEVFPSVMCNTFGVPGEAWWSWDEPYKITYREYVHNQTAKEASVYAINAVMTRSDTYERLDVGWKAAMLAHYGALPLTEYLSVVGEARMARFGRACAWRNQALYGMLDEMRHTQLQAYFGHQLLPREPRADWAHRLLHTNNWGAVAARALLDDVCTAADATSIAVQLTFAIETGFTNLQFLGMAADALNVGDIDLSAMVSSIQTDEARHAQQGEPTIGILIANGRKDEAQRLVDIAFWRTWHLFATLTGSSMDYYVPLAHRMNSFKEFMTEWIIKQFLNQFRDLGLEKPWYWDEHFIPELEWFHHGQAISIWHLRPTVWWDPYAGARPAERQWLESKYPGWNESFGKMWDATAATIRDGEPDRSLASGSPLLCNICNLGVVRPADYAMGYVDTPDPFTLTRNGRTYSFCSVPCKWIFETNPERYEGFLTVSDRVLAGLVQPDAMMDYMSMSEADQGKDAENYAWARSQDHASVPAQG